MARDVIRASTRFLVHSRYAAQLARFEAAPEDEAKICVIPFGVAAPAPRARRPDDGAPIIATFGIATAAKQTEKIIRAFARLTVDEADTRLAVVGSFPDPVERAGADRLADELGIAHRTILTGRLGAADYERWLERAAVAVQLRSWSNGETSAAVMACLSAGVPTIVSDIGAASELPDSCVVKVPAGIGTAALADELQALLREPGRRRALSEASEAYVRAHSVDRTVAELYDLVMEEDAAATTIAGAA
jgi:glycosyltransferase involved in cell wall biosynthesis